MIGIESLAHDPARQAIRVLNGEDASAMPVVRGSGTSPMFDARQLHRWHVAASRLPAGSIVRFQEFSVWDAYRWPIIGILSVVMFQTALTAGLLFQRFRRHRAERRLRESEEYLTLAGESVDGGIWAWEPASGGMLINPKSRELLGLAPAQPLDYRSFVELVHPHDRQTRQAAVETALAGGDKYDIEYRIIRPDGEIRWLACRGFTERDKHGTILCTRSVLHDVSWRIKADVELQRDREEVAHLTRIGTLGALTASISHELAQPLEAILNLAEAANLLLAAARLALEDVREIVVDIQHAGNRAGEVMAKVRGLFQKRPFQPEALPAGELLHDVAKLPAGWSALRQVTVRVECDAPLPDVWGDRVYLQQVLINLARNGGEASLHLPPDQREVVLSARRNAGGGVAFQVRDRGMGIPPDDMAQIFEPFHTTKPEGLGLGLSLVRTIVAVHGGRVWAENNRDGGATVGFVVPAVGDEACP